MCQTVFKIVTFLFMFKDQSECGDEETAKGGLEKCIQRQLKLTAMNLNLAAFSTQFVCSVMKRLGFIIQIQRGSSKQQNKSPRPSYRRNTFRQEQKKLKRVIWTSFFK